MRRHGVILAATTLLLAIAACGGEGEVERDAPSSADPEVSPLSREEIEQHAEAMSPALAESLGIVDTTIRIESPMPAESIPVPEFEADSLPPQ